MKKTAFVTIGIGIFIIVVANAVHAETLAERLSGRILLQVEQHGEAWYVYPEDGRRYYMGGPSDAYGLMRELGLGITDSDLATIPTSAEAARVSSLAERLSGRILLQVEQHGEAWYVNPVDGRRSYMGGPNDAYQLMRELGLGITDGDLDAIATSDVTSSLGTISGQSTTFIKQYRLDVTTKAGGVWQTRDGGYLMNGQTDDLNPFFPPEGFIARTDASGNVVWSKLFQSFDYTTDPMASPYGEEDGQEIIEMSDGGIIAVGDIFGFVDDEYVDNKEGWEDVYVTRLDKDGNHVWTKMIGDYGTDQVDQVIETNDGGFLVSLKVDQLCDCSEPVDMEKNYVLAKYDSAGEREWIKKTGFVKSALYTDPFIVRETSDGYVMIGQAEAPEGEGFMSSSVPTLVKTDGNLNIVWAKSLEAISQQYASAIPNGDGTFTLGYTTMRLTAGDFQDVELTSDGGYLAFGFFYDVITQGTYATYVPSTSITLAAAKFDGDGNLLWVKSLASEMEKMENRLYATKTADGNFVVMIRNYVNSDHHEEYVNDPEKYLSIYSTSGAFLIKADQDFNILWSTSVGGDDYIDAQDLEPTSDGGVVISGYYVSPEVATVSFGENIYYQDAILIKLDVNGNATGGDDWVSDESSFAMEDVSSYVITEDLSPSIDDYAFGVDKEPTPSVPDHAVAVADLVPATTLSVTSKIGPFLAEVSTPTVTTETKTWAQINYDDVTPVETTNAKSQAVHDDLLPGLNEIFGDEVKLRDNMGGYSLDYVFSRVVTEDDVTAMRDYLEGVGYSTYDSDTDQLTMMKVGYFLSMTFSVSNQNKGTLGVTF